VIPLYDRNPTRRFPIVTVSLIVACFIVFVYELSLTMGGGGDAALATFFDSWGAVPSKITASLDAGDYFSQATLGIVTSIFLHGGWLHILGNMLYLWIFGNNVEDRLGRLGFLLFYLVGGIVAALAQVVIDPSSSAPLVGASGAIAAALGAYLILFPGARILSLVFLGFFYQLLNVPALIILGFWFVLQLISGFASFGVDSAQGGVAFFAHIGGFAFGMVIGALLRVGGAARSGLATGPGG
jgi:membrane associated rhomboid family serine protease